MLISRLYYKFPCILKETIENFQQNTLELVEPLRPLFVEDPSATLAYLSEQFLALDCDIIFQALFTRPYSTRQPDSGLWVQSRVSELYISNCSIKEFSNDLEKLQTLNQKIIREKYSILIQSSLPIMKF